MAYGTSLMILLHCYAYLEREILDLQTFDYALFFFFVDGLWLKTVLLHM